MEIGNASDLTVTEGVHRSIHVDETSSQAKAQKVSTINVFISLRLRVSDAVTQYTVSRQEGAASRLEGMTCNACLKLAGLAACADSDSQADNATCISQRCSRRDGNGNGNPSLRERP